MPKYQMYFDTIRGETKYNVDVDESESIEDVLDEILYDLREGGDVLQGDGEPQVVWNGLALDFDQPDEIGSRVRESVRDEPDPVTNVRRPQKG